MAYEPIVHRVALLADLHPPLGKPGGPCHVINRIERNVHSPGLKEDLVEDVNKGQDLTNSEASKVYPILREHGVGPIKTVEITSHGQYRMDLRGITVDDVRKAIGSFLRQMDDWKAKNNPAFGRMTQMMERGDKLEWVDPQTRLKVVLAPNGSGHVTLVSTFRKGQPDPSPPQGTCEVPRKMAQDEDIVARVAAVFLAASDDKDAPRERGTGRYLHTKWTRLCRTCGHPVGVHAAEKSHGHQPCFASDLGIDCNCEVFKPTNKFMSDEEYEKNWKMASEGLVVKVAAKYKQKIETDKGNTVYTYSDKQVAARNKKKAERIEALRKSIGKLRTRVKRDIKSDDPEKALTALAVALIDHTYERVGNEDSASDGHYGVTGWKKKHISFQAKGATIKYVGKSGVKHTKKVTDLPIKQALKQAYDACDGDNNCLFSGDWGSVTAEKVNDYLEPFDVTAKDIRGFHANREMQTRLKEIRKEGGKLPAGKKAREKLLKTEFLKALDDTAEAVGHEAATLRSQYLVPGLEESYMKDGAVSDKMSSVLDPNSSQAESLASRFLLGLL